MIARWLLILRELITVIALSIFDNLYLLDNNLIIVSVSYIVLRIDKLVKELWHFSHYRTFNKLSVINQAK